mmetsp:Transcript_10690/g.43227  ORF Transcript_10690/g.43227 Transcript_10690/m.43227 type:complete len:403 (-) Transcript_10690:1073-2281(-)
MMLWPTHAVPVMSVVLWTTVSALTHTLSPSVYQSLASSRTSVDQAAFESGRFWAQVEAAIPGPHSPELERFRGFCENLRTAPPETDVFLDSGQQLLAQYVYPGLDDDDDDAGVPARRPYPSADWPALARLEAALEQAVAPAARRELGALVTATPLASEDDDAAWRQGGPRRSEDGSNDNGDGWQRAAWFGWQYLSLRAARRHMPETVAALHRATRDDAVGGPAHRFVGVARQKAASRGTVHSDGRNYMLSTLTPILAPEEQCGIVVGGVDRPLATGGPAVVLDNTFPHFVYNDAPEEDRFCLIAEIWHPALRSEEREALATLFAVKDRFTVLELGLAPWGFTEDDLDIALRNGAVHDLAYWKDLAYEPRDFVDASKKKRKASSGKGFGGAPPRKKKPERRVR